ELRGVWALDVDLNALQRVVLLGLARHPFDMTGSQVRFVRNWLGLTQTEFGKRLGVTHPAVVKWEKMGDEGSRMNLSTQRELRLWILDQLLAKDDDFRREFRVIHSMDYAHSTELLKFDISSVLAAA
ncbi:MAG: helix-turn-helix domain-containing protein, partial [Chlamydiia bacterium]|nr:helix-turn-helix domain-containing protein [Chlamydiia bacterium]